MSSSLERIRRWFRRTAVSVEQTAEEATPVATPPPGSDPVGLGDVERETSTNAQMGGASDEPWPGNT